MTYEWYELIITIDGDVFEDAIQEKNEVLALEKAKWNWDYASSIELKVVE